MLRQAGAALAVFGLLVLASPFIIPSMSVYKPGNGGCPVGTQIINAVTSQGNLVASGSGCLPNGGPNGGNSGITVYLWVENSMNGIVASKTVTTSTGGSFDISIPFSQLGVYSLYAALCPSSSLSTCAYPYAVDTFGVASYGVTTQTVTFTGTYVTTASFQVTGNYTVLAVDACGTATAGAGTVVYYVNEVVTQNGNVASGASVSTVSTGTQSQTTYSPPIPPTSSYFKCGSSGNYPVYSAGVLGTALLIIGIAFMVMPEKGRRAKK
ncbi:MAG: hypothetical protein JRM77_04765 [Nitrososphaerota archaeon]|nr:hypothetical protein [Nitrososphaerota archaeon]